MKGAGHEADNIGFKLENMQKKEEQLPTSEKKKIQERDKGLSTK